MGGGAKGTGCDGGGGGVGFRTGEVRRRRRAPLLAPHRREIERSVRVARPRSLRNPRKTRAQTQSGDPNKASLRGKRRGGDSNSRAGLLPLPVFETGPFNHSGTSPSGERHRSPAGVRNQWEGGGSGGAGQPAPYSARAAWKGHQRPPRLLEGRMNLQAASAAWVQTPGEYRGSVILGGRGQNRVLSKGLPCRSGC